MSNAERYAPEHTVEEYKTWQGDWELWAGRAVSLSPSPNFRHQDLAMSLGYLLRSTLNDSNLACQACRAVLELDWEIDPKTVIRPDVLIACGADPRTPP